MRDPESVDALLAMMRKLGKKKQKQFMTDFRIALTVLTGGDFGRDDSEAWQRWWKDNEEGFELPESAPQLPERWQRRWEKTWGLMTTERRPRKRGDRGG